MKKKITILMVLLIVLLPFVSACTTEEPEVEVEEEVKIPVQLQTARKDTISNEITLSGRAVPAKEMMIIPQSAAEVEDIKVSRGSKVEKDEVLFTLKIEDSEEVTEILSPVEGRVAAINIKEDEVTSNIQPSMVVVADDNPMTISINATENLITELFIGKKVDIKISALEKENLMGKIASISTAPDERSQQYIANIVLVDELNDLKPGMLATVKLDTNIRENVLVVKSEAILDDGDRKVVFVEEEGLAKEKEVKTGLDTGLYTEIVSGLESGEKVIVKGQNYIEDGSEVETVRGEK
ncbi:efflux RND transporter periplasmic adaptor subunit [Clostridium sp. D2Q-11]|uniref:Efflux RND transporter periplasmic adaptor subunit n=1 Tax=Anaeromonas frigoriresistens TaxID=2683708 RepID=A0A942UUM3_9FIRM|nr:efflux RND transporter periplasmic adaptor subunit [Anaeromonas frigoriresistens]MBS4537094.1 efflux RND transporter periplasmic adaptor subunit [Anaeromonas frigoriresistens]